MKCCSKGANKTGTGWMSYVSLSRCRVWGGKISRNLSCINCFLQTLSVGVLLTWWNTRLVALGLCVAAHSELSARAHVVGYVWVNYLLWFRAWRGKSVRVYANSGHLVSAGDKKSQMLSELMTLEGDLVSDLLCAETLGPSFMQKKKKSCNRVSVVSRHVHCLKFLLFV